MEKQIGKKVRQLRELKGYSQQYMADKMSVSQRAYSKMETNETRMDWSKITKIAEILEMDPMDMVSFDDNLIFNNCKQSGKFEKFINKIPKKLIAQYESRIDFLEKEILFLREELNRR